MKIIETIAFMLIEDNSILAEKRKLTKQTEPGKIVIPGGHIEKDESPQEAVLRELSEELAVSSNNCEYICTLLQKYEKFIARIHYYLINSWDGKIQNNEAEELLWIPLDGVNKLSLEVDRVAIRELARLHP